MSRFADRQGIDRDFFEIDKRSDLMVSASAEQVSSALAGNSYLTSKFENLRLEVDAAGDPTDDRWPLAWAFQLQDQSWTQVSGLKPGWPSLDIAKELSETLATHCFCIEITDDAYGSHALFDRGEVEELALYCTHYDLERILPRLGLPYTPDEEAEEWDEVDYFHSKFRDDGVVQDEFIVKKMGFFIHSGDIGDRTDYGLVGVESPDLARIDLIFSS